MLQFHLTKNLMWTQEKLDWETSVHCVDQAMSNEENKNDE